MSRVARCPVWEGGRRSVDQVASITINPTELRRLSTPDAAEPSELRERTHTAEYIAGKVDKHWDEAPPKLREALVALAYSAIRPPDGLLDRARIALRGGLRYARITFKGEQEVFFDYVIAHRQMTNAILGAIERDNLEYRQALSEGIEGAFSDLEQSEILTPEDTLDQLRQLSDEALRELR
jgi:hypothetical protein